MENSIKKGIFLAILAAFLYALSSPISKILLDYVPSTMLAGLLYIGAGLGMAVVAFLRKKFNKENAKEEKLTKKELPFTIAMILLDIIAPISLLFGLKYTTSANASLLNNFEIVATAIIAFAVFKEKISFRLWIGIILVTLSCALLSVEDLEGLKLSYGSLFILLAALCWGLENNCTRKISSKDPLEIVLLKGIFSGFGSLIIGFVIGERITVLWAVLVALVLGFFAYGLSIFFYVYAQRILGAARTGAYYALAPFIGTVLSLIIFGEIPRVNYFIALFLMIIGAFLSSSDTPIFKRKERKEEKNE